jgi:hypothetical protein
LLSVVPIKKSLKIMLQVNIELGGKIIFGKLSPILNQYGVYDSHLVDEFLNKFIEKFTFNYGKKNPILNFGLKLPIIINIYKRRHKSDILLQGPQINFVFKKLMDRRFLFRDIVNFNRKEYLFIEFFKINMLNNLFFLSTYFNFIYFKKRFYYMQSFLFSLSNRFEMKVRRINFRRKDKKK